jgi:trans-2,3-dihydro-3-hydroxyanthranilate isomerase
MWSSRDAVASALGLSESLMHADLPIQTVSCGLPYLLIPMRDRAPVDAAVFDPRAMRAVYEVAGVEPRSVLVFAPETDADVVGYSRRFGFAVLEDAATGAAAGPLGCYLLRHRVVTMKHAQRMVNVQGVKMGRPSRLHIRVDGEPDAITNVRVGGTSVVVGEGHLRL